MMAAAKNTKTFYNSEVQRDWSSPEFGDVFNFLKTFSFSREQLTSETTTDEIRNIHYGDIHATYENEILDFEIEKTVPYLLDGIIDAKSFEDENFPSLKEGDLIIADASEDYEGVCDCVELKNINGAKVVSGLHTFAARASEDKIALGYRTYALQHEQVIRELRRIATGTSVYGVSKTNLSKVKIPLPPLPEQKAIAQVLSTADAAIHTTEKLIAQKELRKKWLMQQLLTGKKRLKGFGGEWKERKLEYFIKEYKQKPSAEDNYEVLTSAKSGLMKQTDYYGDNRITNRDDADYNVIPPNYLTYRSRSDDGLFTFNKNDLGITGLISGYYPVFTFKNGDLDFILMYMNYYKQKLTKYAIGTSQLVLAMNALKEAKFVLPEQEEQTAIAQVLQAADKEISLLKAKAEKLREQKKGLMQVLLTGKVRLKIK